jgi:hypothetical protein
MFMNLLHACIKLESSSNVYHLFKLKVVEMFIKLLHASIKQESIGNVYEFVTCIYNTGK